MIRHSDRDIEYRITEVEKSASRDEEKVKQELYDALRDKNKIIVDLRDQLAFRNSALDHELSQRKILEDDRMNLALRLEEALCSTQGVILSTEETQTPLPPHCSAVATQISPTKRAAHTQTWDPPQLLRDTGPSPKTEMVTQVKKLQEQICEMRRQQTVIERSYEKRLTELRLQHARASDALTKTHFSQEKLLGGTVLQLQEENSQLRQQVSLLSDRNLIISSDSDDFNSSGFCCAPRVTRKKKKKKEKRQAPPPPDKDNSLPNPYGLHSSQKGGAFWGKTGSDI